MSGFQGRVKTDISQWHATKYATIPPEGATVSENQLISLTFDPRFKEIYSFGIEILVESILDWS